MCLLIEDIWKGMAVDDAILTVVNIREKSILVTKLNPTEKACPAFEGGRGVVRHESLLAKVPVQQQIGTERGLPMPACLLMPARMPGGRTGGARARAGKAALLDNRCQLDLTGRPNTKGRHSGNLLR